MDIIDKNILHTFLEEIVWSYSNIKTFNTCKRCWYRRYILGEEELSNFYAEYGLLVHKLLEQYANHEIDLLDMKQFVEYNWNKYINTPPLDGRKLTAEELLDNYYLQYENFCNTFSGFKDKTLGVEIEFFTDIFTKYGKVKFHGFIDRLSQDGDDYIITDYKSKLSLSKKELKEFSKQLYFYSTYVKEKYGKFPNKLKFLLFRTMEEVVIDFDEKEYENIINEISSLVEKVYEEEEFICNYSYFFCNNLCGFRDRCSYE